MESQWYCTFGGESMKKRGSRGGFLLMLTTRGCPKARVPSAKQPLQLVVQNLRTHLDQKVGALPGPLHLLRLHHPLTDSLVHRGFDERCRDPFLIAIPFPEIWKEGAVVLYVDLKFVFCIYLRLQFGTNLLFGLKTARESRI